MQPPSMREAGRKDGVLQHWLETRRNAMSLSKLLPCLLPCCKAWHKGQAQMLMPLMTTWQAVSEQQRWRRATEVQ